VITKRVKDVIDLAQAKKNRKRKGKTDKVEPAKKCDLYTNQQLKQSGQIFYSTFKQSISNENNLNISNISHRNQMDGKQKICRNYLPLMRICSQSTDFTYFQI